MRELLTEEEIAILRSYAKFNLQTQPVADEMHFHRITIFKKLLKIYQKTGLDPHNFWDLVKLLQQIDEEVADGRK